MKQVNELLNLVDSLEEQIRKMNQTSKEFYEMSQAIAHLRNATMLVREGQKDMKDYNFSSKVKANKFARELRNRCILSKVYDKEVSVYVKDCKLDAEGIADRLYNQIF